MPCVAEVVNRSLKADCTDLTSVILDTKVMKLITLETQSQDFPGCHDKQTGEERVSFTINDTLL